VGPCKRVIELQSLFQFDLSFVNHETYPSIPNFSIDIFYPVRNHDPLEFLTGFTDLYMKAFLLDLTFPYSYNQLIKSKLLSHV
jgi:hypothetical protein